LNAEVLGRAADAREGVTQVDAAFAVAASAVASGIFEAARANVVDAAAGTSRLPAMVSTPLKTDALAITGKFCKLFGPVSPSSRSFEVTPSGHDTAAQWSMPSASLALTSLAKYWHLGPGDL
jgi:hypothetical protein